MFVNMDVMNINNGRTSGHVDESNVEEETPSRMANGTTKSGKFENQMMCEGERAAGRKRKTRRFKSRYKGKSCPPKYKFGILKKMRTRAYPQSEAPNNTNQFLMAEHTIENLEDTLLREKRHRESSFTSADTDDEQFYSSPEDEDEFLTRDFDTAYQSMCAEKFGNLSKAQLTKIIFELEAKVDELNKKLVTNSRLEEMSNMLMQMSALENKDEIRIEIKDMLMENERLRRENEELRQHVRPASSSSSSSSSSGESESESDSNSNSEPKMEAEVTVAKAEENIIDQRPC